MIKLFFQLIFQFHVIITNIDHSINHPMYELASLRNVFILFSQFILCSQIIIYKSDNSIQEPKHQLTLTISSTYDSIER